MKIFIDGKWLDKKDAKISTFDHGLLYGDGIFEGIRAYNGRVFKLSEHVERLFASAKGIMLDIPYTFEEIEKIILTTVKNNQLKDGYIRVLVTRGVGDLGLDIRKCEKPTVIVIADKIELYPAGNYEKGLKVITSSLRRVPGQCLSPSIKSLNYLNNVMARAEATRAGAAEAILLTTEGHVSECSGDNIFLVGDNEIRTTPTWIGILPGITRACVIELIQTKLQMTLREEPFTLPDLYNAKEVFVTGTGAEIIGVTEIDSRKIGKGKQGPITYKIRELYADLVNSTGTPVYEKSEV
ncbi:branched-chain-amino-acid transaminase [Elusimicrobiota bacterium]